MSGSRPGPGPTGPNSDAPADPTGPQRLVLGFDVGATWTRALLATTTGRRLATGRAPGANPTAHGTAAAAARIAEALAAALAGADPSTVRRCVIGLAGNSQYDSDPRTVEAFTRVWREAGLTCPVQVISDVAVAFAAGTTRPSGTVLLAGTGAIAAEIRDREAVAIHGGYGWLLGDDGSGFWIGRQAVRAALSALDGRAPMSPLPKLVLDWYLADPTPSTEPPTAAGGKAPRPAAALISEVTRRPPPTLAQIAPLVMQAHAAGDEAAATIVSEAAALLVENLAQVGPSVGEAPVVLAGGLLASPTPLRELVVSAILARWPSVEVHPALDGSAAAAWLAALPLLDDGPAADALHTRLMAPGSEPAPGPVPATTD